MRNRNFIFYPHVSWNFGNLALDTERIPDVYISSEVKGIVQQEKLNPSKVLVLLKDENPGITLEEVCVILEFMRLVSDVVIERHLFGHPDKPCSHLTYKDRINTKSHDGDNS